MDASARENDPSSIRRERKSRRSSILKRRPLGNLNEELKDSAALLPSKRRVSFAPCNEMREIFEDTTDLSSHVKIPAVALPEDSQVLTGATAQHDPTAPQVDQVSSQTSTPVGAKRPKRMSLAFSRLSIIPPDGGGGAPCHKDDDSAILLLDNEGLGGQEGPSPSSAKQLGTNAFSDLFCADDMSLEPTFTAPHGKLVQPVLGKVDASSSAMELTCTSPHLPNESKSNVTTDKQSGTVHAFADQSMDAEDFSAYEDHSNDLPQNLPKTLDATSAALAKHATNRGLARPTSHSVASGGLCDLVLRKQESLTAADMSLDLSCTSSPGQPHIHPDLVGVTGKNRNPDSRERRLTHSLTMDAHRSNASNMSMTCETVLHGKDGVSMADGRSKEPEDGQSLQRHVSSDTTTHTALPDASSMSLTCEQLQGSDTVPVADRSSRDPEDGHIRHTCTSSVTSNMHPPTPLSLSQICENPLHSRSRAQGRNTSTSIESRPLDAAAGAPMDQLPAAMDSSVTELTCRIPAIQPLMPHDSSKCGNTSNISGSHVMTLNDSLPDTDTGADVKGEENNVVLQSPANGQTKTSLVTASTLKPSVPSTSVAEPPSQAQLANTMPLSTSVATSATHGLPKIGLTRQSKARVVRSSTRNLRKRISVPRSVTATKVSALAQVTFSASGLHSSASSLPSTSTASTAMAPPVREDTAREAGKAEHCTSRCNGEEDEVTVPEKRSSNLPGVIQQDVKEDVIEHTHEVTLPVEKGLSEEKRGHVQIKRGCLTVSEHFKVIGDNRDQQNHTSEQGSERSCVQEEEHSRVQKGEHSLMHEGERSHVQEGECSRVQEEEHSLMHEGERSRVQEGERSHVQEGERSHVQERERSHVQEGERSHVQERERSHVQEGERSHVQERERSHVQGERSHVQEGEHSLMHEGERSRVQEGERSHVHEGEHSLMHEGERSRVQEGECSQEQTLTPCAATPDGGTPMPKSEYEHSFKSSVTPSTSSCGRPSSAVSQSVSVSALSDFTSSTNSSLAPVTAKCDDGGPLRNATVPHYALRRRLNRTYSVSPDNSFTCLKEGESSEKAEESTFNYPFSEKAAPSVAGLAARSPFGTTPSHPSPCPSEGNWMQSKGVDISLVDNSIVSFLPDQDQTPQIQPRPEADEHEEEGSRYPVTTPVCTSLTVVPPHTSGIDVQRNAPAGPQPVPTEDMDISHGNHASASDVSNCQVASGALNTTLQPTGYDSPLLQVFKTPGGSTPGVHLRSNVSLVTTPWSAPSPLTPGFINPSTPGVTAVGLWKHLPAVLNMENAPEFFNVDRAEIKTLEKAEVLKRLAAGYQELHAVLQSEEGGETLASGTVDARILQTGLNCAMEGTSQLYALMKYQEQYCGKLFPWSLEDQVSSVYDPIEVSFEEGDRLHWIARKRVEMELLADRAKVLMMGTSKAYRWLVHSWAKDRFKIIFFQPVVVVTVDVSPVCELGSHMIDAEVKLNVRDNQLQSKETFTLDDYTVQGSLPKVVAEVLLKIAVLCKEQRSKLL